MNERVARPDETPDDGAIDLRALGRRVAVRKWWIIVPTLIAFLGMLLWVSTVRPRYTADAKVFLDNQESYYTRPDNALRDAAVPLDPEAVMSQVQLVTSREIAREAIARLKLAGDAEFDPLARGVGVFDRIMILAGLMRDPGAMAPEDRILDKYYEKLTVFQVPKTRVLSIEFTSQKPELAAKAANVIADLYIKLRSDVKKGDALKARDWLGEQIKSLKPKVEAAHLAVARYREQNGLLRGAGERNTLTQELGELVTKLSDARGAQSEAEGKAVIIKRLLRQGRIMDIPDVAKDELIRRIAEQRVALKTQLALELRTLLPGHPRVKELQSQIAEIERELRASAEKVARTLENDATLATARIKFLEAEVAKRRAAAGEGGEKDAQLKMLEQEATALEGQLQSALAKFNDANTREYADSTPPDVRLVSPATAPQLPTFPKKTPMLLLSLLGGLILSGGIVVTRELLAAPPRPAPAPPEEVAEPQRFRVAAHFEEAEPAPVQRRPARPQPAPAETALAAEVDPPQDEPARASAQEAPAPLAPEESAPPARVRPARAPRAPAENIGAPPPLVTHDNPAPEPMAANFDELCAAMAHLRREGAGSRVLVSGLREAAGARAALRLARALSRQGSAILIDLTAAGEPTESLALDGLPGVADLLAGEASFADVIQRDLATRLHVLPVGARAEGGAVSFDLIRDALAALAATYEYVVVAAPAAAPALGLREVIGEMSLVAVAAALGTELRQAELACADFSRQGVEALLIDMSRPLPRGKGASRDAA